MRWADLWRQVGEAVGNAPPRNTTEQSTGQWLGPELRVTFRPAYPGRPQEESDKWRTEGVWRPGEAAPEASAPVLVSSAKLTQGRHGLLGLTNRGRKWLIRAAETLQERPRTCAMVTGTFSRKQLEALAEPGCMSEFHKRLLENVVRLLVARGLPGHLCFVWELQPERTAREGLPGMHYHLLAPYRLGARRRPLISLKAWKRAHERAFRQACRYDGEIADNGVRIEAVRTTCTRYLTSYMKKPAESPAVWAGSRWENLIPRQWWAVSGELRALILGRMRPVSAEFLEWVGRHGAELRGKRLVRTVAVHEFAPVAPTWLIWFADRAAVAQCARWWHAWKRRRDAVALYAGWETSCQTLAMTVPSSA